MDPETSMQSPTGSMGYDGRNTDEAEEADDESIRSEDRDDDEDNGVSEDEKQMEEDHPVHRRLQEIVKSIKRKEIDWDKPKDYFGSKPQGQFSPHLRSERNDDCILHFLIKDEDATTEEIKELAKAIKYIARFHPKLMTTQNKESLTPLYLALDNLDKRRVYLIRYGFFKSQMKVDHMAKAIGTPCGVHQENCLHRALKSQPVHYTVLNLLIDSANQQAVNARDAQDWTPLHRAVHFEHSSEEMLGIIQKLIQIGEPDSTPNTFDSPPVESAFDTYSGPERGKLSVYEYHMKTRYEEEQREKTQAAKSSSSSRPPKAKAKREDHKQEDQVVKSRLLEKDVKKGGEIQQRMNATEKENINQDRLARGGKEEKEAGWEEEMPKPGLIRANTNAKRVIFRDNNVNPKATEKKDTKAEKRQERERWSQEIRNALKLHSLRTRTIAQATRFLYGTNKDDVQLYFDYSGLPKDDADPGTFYENFQMTRFDQVLQYVEFPAVRLKEGKMPRRETFDEHRAFYHSKTNGRKDLLFFFSWLKDKGVKHIIKVIVQDTTDPHCDEVIEKCLSPFRIDVLDWSKPDLDPEMLHTACPDVKELHLRWGGNNAILRSWSELEGLRRLRDLCKIYLYYDQTSDYTEQKVEMFAKRLDTALPVSTPGLEASVMGDDRETAQENEGSTDSISTSSLAEKQIQVLIARDLAHHHLQTPGAAISEDRVPNKPSFTVHKWLESIDTFSGEIKTLMDKIKTCHKGDEVKVALIDDGVDLCERAFRDKIIHGKSLGYYWDGVQRDQRAKQWYVSETGHGTVMAHMILRVCPMAKIYPIKLDTGKDPKTGALRIKPESAAAAIDAAVEKGVHIISMSWTVSEPQDEIKTKFDEALSNAAQKKILMFCSSPDEGNYSGDHYPTAYGPDKFFRIGASQADGHAYSWISLDKVDYLFPGVDVVQANKKDIKLRGVEDRKAETGSSISTALAAGLAALVLWFVIIGAKYSWDENQGGGDGLDANDVKAIQNIKAMKQAFKKLGASRESNEKFIEIWSELDDRAKALKELHGDQNIKAARQVIHKLARNLIAKT